MKEKLKLLYLCVPYNEMRKECFLMKVNKLLLDEKYVFKYFYCNIEDNEYILCGNNNGVIFNCSYSGNIGNIIIDILENKDFIYSILQKYYNKILNEKYQKDEVFNQEIIWRFLVDLQMELESSKIIYFQYLNIATYISKKFVAIFNKIDILKEKYNTISDFSKDFDIDFLNEEEKKYQYSIDNIENLTFKRFALNELDNLLQGLKCLDFNLYTYSSKMNLDIIDKSTNVLHNNIKNPLQKIRLLQQNYTSNIFNHFYKTVCYSKIAIYHKGILYLDDKINNFTDKELNLNMRIIQIFKFDTLIELMNLSLVRIIDKNITVVKCGNCKNFFIPTNRIDEKYCNRISPQNPNKTCKEYGVKKSYRDELKSTPIKYEHNKTSQFFRMRINRTNINNIKEKEMYQKKFNNYKENYQKKKEQYKSGKLKENDFVEWIIKQKEGVKNGNTRTNKK